MSEDNSRRRLGRGLAALIGEMDQPLETQEPSAKADGIVPIEFVERNARNPRRSFDPEDLRDLAASIAQHGIVQPVVVRRRGEGRYEIIAGERRWRAAQQAGLSEIPVIVRDVDDRTALELAIVENVQRSDLNPIEEAMGYDQLIAEHGYTQNDLGDIIGKSRSHVANTLRLLKLPEAVKVMLGAGELSSGHARAIAATSDPERLAREVVSRGLSVRDAEKLAQRDAEAAENPGRSAPREKDADTVSLERSLSDVLGLKVDVNHKSRGGGNLKVEYKTLEQLEELCRLLGARH
jgi:ParB family chromosome partitioning protein